jgi:radical SAM protein with 4Fe4S-binding SPASM domain
MRNISRLVGMRNADGSPLQIGIKFSVSKSLRDQKHYEDGIRLAHELGVDRVTFKATRHMPEEITLSAKVKERQLLRDTLSHNYHRNVVEWITELPDNLIPQCWLNPLHTVMDHLGNIYICCYYYNRGEEHLLGNILETGFASIWYSEDHWQKIRNIDREKCKKVDCKFFYHHHAVEYASKRGRLEFM